MTHCEEMRYRVAALETPASSLPASALDFRNLRSLGPRRALLPVDHRRDPIDGSRVDVPPAAYVAGIWARTDNDRGVIKAPANEVVRSAHRPRDAAQQGRSRTCSTPRA